MKVITGLFTKDTVMTAVHRLRENGFTDDDISLMTATSQLPEYLRGEPEEAAGTGAAVGAVTGGGLGAVGTWAAASILGFGALMASGFMLTAVGGVIGGYLGSMYNVRAESQTKIDLREELTAGKILLLAKMETDEEDKERMAIILMKECDGEHIDSHEFPDLQSQAEESEG